HQAQCDRFPDAAVGSRHHGSAGCLLTQCTTPHIRLLPHASANRRGRAHHGHLARRCRRSSRMRLRVSRMCLRALGRIVASARPHSRERSAACACERSARCPRAGPGDLAEETQASYPASAGGVPEVHSITTAGRSHSEQTRERIRRYLITMGIRTACFAAAIFVQVAWVRLLFLALAALLPVFAGLVANAGGDSRRAEAEYIDQ